MADFQRFTNRIVSFFLKQETPDSGKCKQPQSGHLSAKCNQELADNMRLFERRQISGQSDLENVVSRSDDLHKHLDHRKTTNDLPSISSTNSNARAHWFDGQDHYRGNRLNMSSDSWSRLESFLASRNVDELRTLDPTFGNQIEKNHKR